MLFLKSEWLSDKVIIKNKLKLNNVKWEVGYDILLKF